MVDSVSSTGYRKGMDSETLIHKRTALGLTQHDLAIWLGVSDRTVSKWERGMHRIPQSAAIAIAAFQEKNMSSNTTLTADHDLPEGWEDEAAFLATFAGQEYAARRWTDGEDFPHPAAQAERYEMEPEHPESYALVFPDGSAFIANNAGDEVWESFGDYLSEYGVGVRDGHIIALEG